MLLHHMIVWLNLVIPPETVYVHVSFHPLSRLLALVLRLCFLYLFHDTRIPILDDFLSSLNVPRDLAIICSASITPTY